MNNNKGKPVRLGELTRGVDLVVYFKAPKTHEKAPETKNDREEGDALQIALLDLMMLTKLSVESASKDQRMTSITHLLSNDFYYLFFVSVKYIRSFCTCVWQVPQVL